MTGFVADNPRIAILIISYLSIRWKGVNARHPLFVLAQPANLLRTPEKHKARQRTHDSQAPQEQTDRPPRRQPTMSLGVGPNAIHHQVRDDLEAGKRGREEERARGLFVTLVPAAYDKEEAGRDGAFKEALERSQDHQMSPVLGGGNAGHADAPAEHVDAEGEAEIPMLKEEVGGKLSA